MVLQPVLPLMAFDLPKGLKISHWNVQSLANKIADVLILLTNKECDNFCLSETWLTPAHPNNEFTFPGYKLSRKDRSNGMNHGGVAIYVDEKLKFKCRDDLYSPDDETIIIEVVYKRFSSFLPSVTYRAPNRAVESASGPRVIIWARAPSDRGGASCLKVE